MSFAYIPLKLILGILQIQGNLLQSLNKSEKTEGTINNGQSRDTGKLGARQDTETTKTEAQHRKLIR